MKINSIIFSISQKKAELDRSFADFLDDKNIGILKPLFYPAQTAQGYGRLEKIPALYGLMWNTPKMMTALQKRMVGRIKDSGNSWRLRQFKQKLKSGKSLER